MWPVSTSPAQNYQHRMLVPRAPRRCPHVWATNLVNAVHYADARDAHWPAHSPVYVHVPKSFPVHVSVLPPQLLDILSLGLGVLVPS